MAALGRGSDYHPIPDGLNSDEQTLEHAQGILKKYGVKDLNLSRQHWTS